MIEGDPEEAIRTDSVAAVAIVGPRVDADGTRGITVLYDAASDRSNRGRDRLSEAVGEWRDSLLAGRLDDRALPRSFALPVASRATLELVDVSGRRVASRDVGTLGAGRHEMNLGEGQRLSSGIYFVRLTQGVNVATRRVTVLE